MTVSLLAAALLTTACGGGGNGNANANGKDAAQGAGVSADVDRSAVFNWAYSVSPTSLDPHRGASEYDLIYLWPVYDRLTYLNADGEVEPMLAESWELAEDGSTFTMELREDVTFSDGEPFNAEAVQVNLDRVINDPRSSIAEQLNQIVESVEVVDDYTVRLNLMGPGGALPQVLGSRAGMMISPAAIDNPDLDQNPVGSGAFTMTDNDPGARYAYERRDDYWDEDAYPFAGMELVVQSNDATRLNGVRSGELDATFIREQQVAEAEAAGLEVTGGERLSFYALNLNSARSEFGDPKVRQAISLAMDRQAIADGVFGGGCEPTIQPFPEGYFAHADDVPTEDWMGPEVERSKELLAEAGASDLTFTALVPNITGYQSMAQVLQQQFAAAGITMNLQVVDAAQASTLFNDGSADAVVGSFGGGTDPSVYTSMAYLPEGSNNPGGLSTPELQQLHLEAMESADTEERAQVYDELFEEVFEMGPAEQIVCFRTGELVSKDKVDGLEVFLTGTYDFRDVSITK
jgi:peptide/nickel transport system substrate-binding protein